MVGAVTNTIALISEPIDQSTTLYSNSMCQVMSQTDRSGDSHSSRKLATGIKLLSHFGLVVRLKTQQNGNFSS
jgi:hypothetical protein